MPDYESIPTSGQHRGPQQSNDTGTEVRAEEARSGQQQQSEAATYQLVHSEAEGRYRLRRWVEGTEAESGYREVGRYRQEELDAALGNVPSEARFVVLENSSTGEVQMEQQKNFSGDWTDGGRFDQVILFDDEADAAAYAASRQG